MFYSNFGAILSLFEIERNIPANSQLQLRATLALFICENCEVVICMA